MDDADTRVPTVASEYRVHAQTYHRFMLAVKWIGIAMAASLSFLTLYFATSASFLGAFIVGAVIFALGAWAMSHGLAESSEPEDAPGVSVREH